MSVLAARGLSIARDGRRVLEDVSAEFSGGLTLVIGPNGAGKSTLLLALAGLLDPTSGSVTLNGAALSQLKPDALARRRAYLPQKSRCDWPISVARLVGLGLTPHLPMFGDFSPAHSEAIRRALAVCDLADLAERRADALSGGELARAMLARAIVGEPEIIIVDEPISGLDPRHALEAMALLKRCADGGALVIVSAHEIAVAAGFADRIVALKGGRVVADGRATDALTGEALARVFDVSAEVRWARGRADIRFGVAGD